MIKKLFIIVCLTLFATNSFSAGSDPKPEKVKTDYVKAVESIKFAKKFEKKGKLEKAKKRYEKAQKLLLRSNSTNTTNTEYGRYRYEFKPNDF